MQQTKKQLELHEYLERQRNPVQQGLGSVPAIANSWLNTQHRPSAVQRIGFALMSMLFLGAGTFCAKEALVFYADGDFGSLVLPALASLGFCSLGATGFWNSLAPRVQKRSSASQAGRIDIDRWLRPGDKQDIELDRG